MRVCPLCQARYDEDVRKCPYDGRRPLPESVVSAAGGDSLLGACLVERYTIVGRVGAGGMGTVYRAEQAPMNREIALKVLRRDLGRDPETVARFHREARTLSQLKHHNTVTLFDFGQTEDGLLYLAMELLEGEMLSTRLKRVGPIDVPLAIRIAAGVLRSLGEAHSRGIIHRDLKPDNIFLAKVHGRPEEDEVVKVVDFGIAKIRDGERGLEPLQTQEGTVFGTPRYMSPEQAQGKTLDGRSDLYAVGVLLFHMLTGRAPFTDDDAVVVMAHHIKTVPPPVRQVAPGRPIPASLEALVARALEKDPDNRPQNAEAFLAELEKTLDEARAMAAAALAPSVPPNGSMPPTASAGVAVVGVPGARADSAATTARARKAAWIGAGALALFAVIAGLATASPRTTPGATNGATARGNNGATRTAPAPNAPANGGATPAATVGAPVAPVPGNGSGSVVATVEPASNALPGNVGATVTTAVNVEEPGGVQPAQPVNALGVAARNGATNGGHSRTQQQHARTGRDGQTRQPYHRWTD